AGRAVRDRPGAGETGAARRSRGRRTGAGRRSRSESQVEGLAELGVRAIDVQEPGHEPEA
ncbi:hypothetical protein HMPREF0058_2105, partial [Actinomyces urogenitalis DSM 15434]